MTAEQKHRQDWLEMRMDCDGMTYRQAKAAWHKRNEDGPDEMPTTDLGVWDLPRCEGGLR